MCGLFGFVGNPDMDIVRAIAGEAAKRGPHAWGFAFDCGTVNGMGCLLNHMRMLDCLEGASWCIGNARMATFGASDERNNQPIRVGKVTVVHNGNIYAAGEIMHRFGHTPQTQSDTEALAVVLDADLPDFGFFDIPYGGAPQAALWKRKGEPAVHAACMGHPLYYTLDLEGCVYLCSRPALVVGCMWVGVVDGFTMVFRSV